MSSDMLFKMYRRCIRGNKFNCLISSCERYENTQILGNENKYLQPHTDKYIKFIT